MNAGGAVRGLLEAARGLACRREALVPELVRSTGLSREGVELALERYLEVDATDAEIAALVARAGSVACVSVVLSANVFVGALRAIALARAAAPRVVVRSSRREPVFARALVEAAGDPAISLDDELDVGAVSEGEIHVYGRDRTIADVRARASVPVRGHGTGMGLAVVDASTEPASAAARLADDVIVFDQRGCLSPRIAIVEGDPSRAIAFAEALHGALERGAKAVPRGFVADQERAGIVRYIDTMAFGGRVLRGTDHVVGVAAAAAPLVLPPPARTVHVAPAGDLSEAGRLAEPLASAISTVGCDAEDLAIALARMLGLEVRCARLGRMQRPPFDGPVDLRGG